jgi:hypothetical protein
MAFVNDLEDINSVCMTAVAVCSISGPAPTSHRHWSLSSSLQLVFHPHGVLRCAQNLLEKYNIAPTDIGRLAVSPPPPPLVLSGHAVSLTPY